MKKSLMLTSVLFISLSCGGPENGGENSDGVDTLEHRIFVTSTSYNGNLGGLTGADAKCKSVAQNAGLRRDYKAIVSNVSTNIADRLTITGSIYKVVGSNKVLIADSASALWSPPLLSAVDRNENEASVTSGSQVWTGSADDGTKALNFCDNWNSNSVSQQGDYGIADRTDGQWLDAGSNSTCNNSKRLYCISQ
jgi:hypothetical protein